MTVTWHKPGFRAACQRLLRLLKRDPPLVAAGKIWRYAKWRIPSEITRSQMRRLPNAEARFTKIYRSNFWAAKESVSGPGSSLDNTEHLRKELAALFERFSIKSVFDAPCGDFHWMRMVVDANAIDYVGGDIVRPMIEANRLRYERPGVAFRHLDITRDPFPRVDLWFCRDCFFHLSVGDILAALRQFIASDSRYMLASTHKDAIEPKNFDIVSGDFRLTDLFAAPFNLPAATLYRIDEGIAEMCLWSRDHIILAVDAAESARKARQS
jgi:SAM-dependent methyltransferase